MPAAVHAIRVKSNPLGLARMILRAAELTGVLLMLGAGSAAVASSPAFLGNLARGDGKTHIRVEPCGGAVCRVNGWVRAATPAKRRRQACRQRETSRSCALVRGGFRSKAQSPLLNADPRRQWAHDHRWMCHGRSDVSEHELDAPRSGEVKFDAQSPAPENGGRRSTDWHLTAVTCSSYATRRPSRQTARTTGSPSCVATRSKSARRPTAISPRS